MTPRAACRFRARWSRTPSRLPRAVFRSTARTRSSTWSRGARKSISGPPARRCTSSIRSRASTARATAEDLFDIARLVDVMEHIHFFQRTVVPPRPARPFEMDFNTCYPSVMAPPSMSAQRGSTRTTRGFARDAPPIAGGEAKWRERPFVSQSNCFVVPPLKFAADACRCLEVAVRGGMPVLLLSAGQAGATAPAALAGPWSRRSPRSWPASSTSMRCCPGRRPSSGRGRSSAISAAAPCRAAARSRRCCLRLRADGALLRPHRRHGAGSQT